MRKGIHPEYFQANVICTGCGNTFVTGATVSELRIHVCSQCHPFYTGKQTLMDTEGRVDKFMRKYAKFQNAAK